jgi:hypothetical protein
MKTVKLFAALIIAFLSFPVGAGQGLPVYTATGTKPTQGGACSAKRVQIDEASGKLWCCVSSQWDACGSVATAATATALAADGANCSAGQAAQGVSTAGAAQGCSTVPTLLGYTPANKAGDTFTGTITGTKLNMTGHSHYTSNANYPFEQAWDQPTLEVYPPLNDYVGN